MHLPQKKVENGQEAESRKSSPNVSIQYLWFGFGRVALFSWLTEMKQKDFIFHSDKC